VGAIAGKGISSEVIGGVRLFTPAQGIAALEHIMTYMTAMAQVGVAEIPDSALLESLYCQGRYLDELRCVGEEIAEKRKLLESLVADIHGATSGEERRSRIQIYIGAVVKDTLSLPTGDVLDIDHEFLDLGVDSFMGMEMKNQFQSLVGTRVLSMSAMQENTTIRSLAAHLVSLMEDKPLIGAPLNGEGI